MQGSQKLEELVCEVACKFYDVAIFLGLGVNLNKFLKESVTTPPPKDPEPVPTADFFQGDYFSGVLR